jgi:hypothetical protein
MISANVSLNAVPTTDARFMARYSCTFSIHANSAEALRQELGKTLRACNFEIIYDDDDYMVGREVPGGVSHAKLVTLEALIHRNHQTSEDGIKMDCILKNEELPLKRDNHCRRVFDSFTQTVKTQTPWQLR